MCSKSYILFPDKLLKINILVLSLDVSCSKISRISKTVWTLDTHKNINCLFNIFYYASQIYCWKVFTHSLQCTKYCLILSQNWFLINEPCRTWLLLKFMSQYNITKSLTKTNLIHVISKLYTQHTFKFVKLL